MPFAEIAQSYSILGIFVAGSRVDSPIVDASHLLRISDGLCRKSRNCCGDERTSRWVEFCIPFYIRRHTAER